MKKISNILIYFMGMILLILACTKDVGLFTEVEFQVLEQHTTDGYVNESLATTVTVIPEEQLPDYEYFYSYSVVEGEGHFQDMNGQILPEGQNIPLNPLSASMRYIGTSVGLHTVKIRAEDSFGFAEEIELNYTINEVPVIWTATSPVTQIAPGAVAAITVQLESGANGSTTSYQRNYNITSGSGSLAENGGSEVVLEEFISISPGVYQYNFIPDALGTVVISFNLKDNYGQEYLAELKFDVIDIISVTDVNVTPSFTTVLLGDTQQLEVIFTPSDATNQGMTWESDNTAVATVDANGLVTTISVGVATITGTSIDNTSLSDTSEITVTNPSNEPPVANDFSVSILTNSTNNEIDVANEISDPESGPMTVSIQGGSPANGTATISGTVISYTPNNGFTGNDTITYLVSDGSNPAVSATITVTVNAVQNLPPTANDFTTSVFENSTNNEIDVANEISDPESGPMTVSIQGGSPANGTATISGTVISYTPNNGFTGNDTITYLVSDGSNPAVLATITVTVSSVVNLPPTANDFDVTVIENSTNNPINVAAEISDPENDPLTVSIQGSPANGLAGISGTVISYAPINGFTGNDQITYLVSDGNNPAVSATITITVIGVVNQPPTANDFTTSVFGNSSNNPINVEAEINDPENDPLTVSIQGNPANGTATISGTVINYTPNNGFTGNDLINYLVSDGNNPAVSATITVMVNGVINQPPTANDFTTSVIENSTNNFIDVAAEINDPENDPLTVSIQGGSPANGTATISGTVISYTPNNGFTGNDLIIYLVSDGNNQAVSATITVRVNEVINQPPTANNFTTTVIGNTTNNLIDVASEINDPDSDPMTVSIQGGSPVNGLATISGTIISYAPNNGFTGNDTITYLVNDGNNPSVSATITVTVTPPNGTPNAVDDNFSTDMNTSTLAGVLLNDTDPDDDTLEIDSFTQPQIGGTVTSGSPLVLVFTPTDGFTGDAIFEYTVTDGNGGFDTATVTIRVNPVDPPSYSFSIDPITSPQTGATVGVVFRIAPNPAAVALGIQFKMSFQQSGPGPHGITLFEYGGSSYANTELFDVTSGTSVGFLEGPFTNCEPHTFQFTVTPSISLPSQSDTASFHYENGPNCP